MQDAGGEGVGEMVEGEGKEAEDFLLAPFLRACHGEQVARGIGRVDGAGDIVQVIALVAGFYPFR